MYLLTTLGRSIEFRLVVVKIDESSHYYFSVIFQLSLNHNKISYILFAFGLHCTMYLWRNGSGREMKRERVRLRKKLAIPFCSHFSYPILVEFVYFPDISEYYG